MQVEFLSPLLSSCSSFNSDFLTTPKMMTENNHVINQALQNDTAWTKGSITGIAALATPDNAAMREIYSEMHGCILYLQFYTLLRTCSQTKL